MSKEVKETDENEIIPGIAWTSLGACTGKTKRRPSSWLETVAAWTPSNPAITLLTRRPARTHLLWWLQIALTMIPGGP